MTARLSPTEIFNGRKIFLIGGTGFLGKVTLSMLLHRFPNVGRVYVTVRARSKEESETRFWNNVITAPPFDPVRERYGAAFEDFIRDKVRVVNGDIGEDRKSTRLNSSHLVISYAVFCLKKKINHTHLHFVLSISLRTRTPSIIICQLTKCSTRPRILPLMISLPTSSNITRP